MLLSVKFFREIVSVKIFIVCFCTTAVTASTDMTF